MTDDTISPLRRRMIEDMTVRGFTACTQRGYVAAVRRFTVFCGPLAGPSDGGRSPALSAADESGGSVVDDHERGGLGLALLFRRDAGPR
jgi:hypothetical protein